MIRLYLLRHAKAVPHVEEGDFDRGLNERGQRDATRIGRLMAERGFAPDQAIASDARRTTQTLTAVLREFASPPRPTLDHDLYLAAPSVLLSAIRAAPKDAKALLLVGHNPGIAELALTLAGAGDAAARRRLEEGFPTAALAVLDFDAPAWTDVRARAGSLRAFETGRP